MRGFPKEGTMQAPKILAMTIYFVQGKKMQLLEQPIKNSFDFMFK